MGHRERLVELVREQSDVSLPELRERPEIDISVQTLSLALRVLPLTFGLQVADGELGRRNKWGHYTRVSHVAAH